MKFTTTILALLAAATSVSAQDYSSIPSCALTCIVQAIASSGCSTTDYQCQCVTKANQITSNATPCIASACSTSDQAKVQPAVAAICASELSSSVAIPTASVASSGSGSASKATATASGSATITKSPSASGTVSKAAATATSTGAAADVRGMGAAMLGVAAVVMAI